MNTFERERTLHGQVSDLLAGTLPSVEVLEVQLDPRGGLVRVYVDAPGGVGHELCVRVTKVIRDLVGERTLEVSSPGIERPLRTAEHFAAAVGSTVRLRTRTERKAFHATVGGVDASGVQVVLPDGSERSISFNDITRCRVISDMPAPQAGHGKVKA